MALLERIPTDGLTAAYNQHLRKYSNSAMKKEKAIGKRKDKLKEKKSRKPENSVSGFIA